MEKPSLLDSRKEFRHFSTGEGLGSLAGERVYLGRVRKLRMKRVATGKEKTTRPCIAKLKEKRQRSRIHEEVESFRPYGGYH